jgi:dCTP deaminase
MFWSSQKIISEQDKAAAASLPLIDPYDEKRVGQGAYELSLSREVAVTQDPESFETKVVRGILNPAAFDQPPSPAVGAGPTLTIPPGQFALLYTKEHIRIPKSVLSFISVKAKVKLKGLVNISGFHVDPGFSGRLKFSVYNAGNNPICLMYDQPCFLIWFAGLGEDDLRPYDKSHTHANQQGISAEDRELMSKPSQSPAALCQRLDRVEDRIKQISAVALLIIFPLLVGLFVALFQVWFEHNRYSNLDTGQSIRSSETPAANQTQK